MKVDDIMTRDVRSCSPDESLSSAAQIMWEMDCGAVPVVDAERRVIGIITDRDICMAAWSQNQSPQQLSVQQAMSKNVVTCKPDDTVETVEGAMRSARGMVHGSDRLGCVLLSASDV